MASSVGISGFVSWSGSLERTGALSWPKTRGRNWKPGFAIALRDAELWDTSPLIGPNVFLNEPGKNDLAEAASELASYASVDVLLEPDTVRRIEQLIEEHQEPATTVPLYEYA